MAEPKKLKGQGFEELIRQSDSMRVLKNQLLMVEEEEDPIPGMSFEDFVQDIFSKSYPMHDFNAWHIHYVCQQIDKLLLKPSNRYLTAALPRYHLKSTICLSPETLIKTIKSYQPIKQIRPGYRVKTHLGRYRHVIKVIKRKINEDIYLLSLKNGEVIRITGNHRVLTKEGWKEVSILSLYDILMVSPWCTNKTKHVSPFKGKTKENCSGLMKVSIKNKEIFSKVNSYDDHIYIIPKSCRKTHVGHTKKYKERPYCPVCGKQLKGLYTTFCSYSCRARYRYDSGLNPNFKFQAFGSNNPSYKDGISTKSYPQEFSFKLKNKIKFRDNKICQNCGFTNNLNIHHIDYNRDNNDELNLITLCPKCNSTANYNREYWKDFYSALIAKKYCLIHNGMRIISIKKEHYSGYVYNLEVEEDNTYCGKGIIYHNCGEALSIYRMLTSYGDGMYISAKDELATYHLMHIKEAVRINPLLNKYLKDQSPQSDSIINYKMGNKKMRIYGSGIMAVKRGVHCDSLLVADDILGDLANPMVLTEFDKVKRLFNAEIMNIPNKECPVLVFGTVMDYSDILFTLRTNPNFVSIWLPAINPTPDREILWPEKFDRKTLDDKKNSTDWKSFATEFLLTPMMAADAFFPRDQLDTIIDKKLVSFRVPGF